jgi:hypothetical protein
MSIITRFDPLAGSWPAFPINWAIPRSSGTIHLIIDPPRLGVALSTTVSRNPSPSGSSMVCDLGGRRDSSIATRMVSSSPANGRRRRRRTVLLAWVGSRSRERGLKKLANLSGGRRLVRTRHLDDGPSRVALTPDSPVGPSGSSVCGRRRFNFRDGVDVPRADDKERLKFGPCRVVAAPKPTHEALHARHTIEGTETPAIADDR